MNIFLATTPGFLRAKGFQISPRVSKPQYLHGTLRPPPGLITKNVHLDSQPQVSDWRQPMLANSGNSVYGPGHAQIIRRCIPQGLPTCAYCNGNETIWIWTWIIHCNIDFNLLKSMSLFPKESYMYIYIYICIYIYIYIYIYKYIYTVKLWSDLHFP